MSKSPRNMTSKAFVRAISDQASMPCSKRLRPVPQENYTRKMIRLIGSSSLEEELNRNITNQSEGQKRFGPKTATPTALYRTIPQYTGVPHYRGMTGMTPIVELRPYISGTRQLVPRYSSSCF